MIKTISAGGVVLSGQGEVLVVNQHGRSWSLPKGHVEDGEDLMTAAKREIHEESGVSNLNFVRELGSYQRNKIGIDGNDDSTEFKTITMFLFTTNETDLKPIDLANPVARWVKKEEVSNLLTHRKDKEFFLSYVRASQSL